MKGRTLAVATGLVWALAVSGCRSVEQYLGDRAADLADVFTLQLTAGRGLAIYAKATPYVGTALGASGQRGIMLIGRHYGTGRAGAFGFLVYGTSWTASDQTAGVCGRALEYDYGNIQRRGDRRVIREDCWFLFVRSRCYGPGGTGPHGAPRWPRNLDVELGASLVFLGAHVGLSPGEFLDLLTGLFGLDIAGDDMYPEMQEQEPKGEQS